VRTQRTFRDPDRPDQQGTRKLNECEPSAPSAIRIAPTNKERGNSSSSNPAHPRRSGSPRPTRNEQTQGARTQPTPARANHAQPHTNKERGNSRSPNPAHLPRSGSPRPTRPPHTVRPSHPKARPTIRDVDRPQVHPRLRVTHQQSHPRKIHANETPRHRKAATLAVPRQRIVKPHPRELQRATPIQGPVARQTEQQPTHTRTPSKHLKRQHVTRRARVQIMTHAHPAPELIRIRTPPNRPQPQINPQPQPPAKPPTT
jgi:hypothetical protein